MTRSPRRAERCTGSRQRRLRPEPESDRSARRWAGAAAGHRPSRSRACARPMLPSACGRGSARAPRRAAAARRRGPLAAARWLQRAEEMVSEPVRTSRREGEKRTRTVQASPSTRDVEPGMHSRAAPSTSWWCSWRASSSLPSRSRGTAEHFAEQPPRARTRDRRRPRALPARNACP